MGSAERPGGQRLLKALTRAVNIGVTTALTEGLMRSMRRDGLSQTSPADTSPLRINSASPKPS